MSKKRSATTDINHENWDKEDPDEHEAMGTFTPANKYIIEKRVMRTAKRRAANPGTEQSVFSGFASFSKAQPSSFDFLANLTNGSKPTNGSPSSKSDTTVSSSLFTAKPGSGSSGGLFSVPVSSTSTTKSTFVIPNSQSSSLFGGPTSTSSASAFIASKADSTVGNFSFKLQTATGLADNNSKAESTSLVSSTMFGIPPNNTKTIKSLFSTVATSSQIKMQPMQSTDTTAPSVTFTPVTDNKTSADKPENKDKKLTYYTKLKGLNESVSDWIKKHVEKTPLCILSPIFKDYEKHLKDIQEEYHGTDSDDATKKHSKEKVSVEPKSEPEPPVKSSVFSGKSSSLFSNSNFPKTNSSLPFSTQSSPLTSFGDKTVSVSNPPGTTNTGFSFGINSSPLNTTSSTNTTSPPPFSFGVVKPFSINNFKAPKPAEAENNAEVADDEPPKVEFTPVEEKDSVFDKKCKIFVKKDGNFVENGVGTLYIKKIEESGKHQLLVRANTNLGNVILNLLLSSSIPTQRMGKNNVMIICIPTPDAKPPPVTVLIRVKTSEEADELLEALNKYKA